MRLGGSRLDPEPRVSLRVDLLALARAIPPPALAAALAALVAAYVGINLIGVRREFEHGEFELGASLSSPTVATVALLALPAGLCMLLGGRGPRALAAAASLLALARLLRAPAPPLGIGDTGPAAAVELALAAVALLGAVWWTRRRLGPLPTTELGPRLERLGRRVAAEVSFRTAAIALVSLVAALIALGAAVRLGGAPLPEFRAGAEPTVAAWISGALLAVTAALALLLARTPGASRWFLVLAAVLALMAIDEPHALHERAEHQVPCPPVVEWLEYRSRCPALIILFPLVVVAGLAWFASLRQLPRGTSTRLFIAGGLLWLASQVLDATRGPAVKGLVEEGAEMYGTTCLLLGLLVAVRAAQAAGPPAPGSRSRPSA